MLLFIRGLVGLFFGALLALSRSSEEDYYALLARYLVVDGAAAAVLAMSLLRESIGRQRGREMGLGVVTLVDAVGRTLSGLALYLWPGIAGFPVTALIFVTIMAACTAAVGLVEAWLTAREELARHGAGHQAPQFMAGPVGLASLLSIGFGVSAILAIGSSGTVRLLISGFVCAAAVVSIAMAGSRRRMERQRRLTPPAPPTPAARR